MLRMGDGFASVQLSWLQSQHSVKISNNEVTTYLRPRQNHLPDSQTTRARSVDVGLNVVESNKARPLTGYP